MRVAVTGATGLVGRHLLPLLAERGHAVRALARPRPGRAIAEADAPGSWRGLEWIVGRLEEPADLVRLTDGADAVIHLAYEHPDQAPATQETTAERYLQANVVATMRLLEIVPSLGAKQLIYASSLAVYGFDPNADPRGERFPRDEDFPLWPIEVYGATRAAVEKWVVGAAHAWSLNASAWRFGLILGTREHGPETPFADTVREAREHGELRTTHGAYCIAAADAARTLADAVGDTAVRGQVFNTFDRWVDFAEFAPVIAGLLGRDIRVACDPAREPRSPIRNDRLRARTETVAAFDTDGSIRALLEELARVG